MNRALSNICFCSHVILIYSWVKSTHGKRGKRHSFDSWPYIHSIECNMVSLYTIPGSNMAAASLCCHKVPLWDLVIYILYPIRGHYVWCWPVWPEIWGKSILMWWKSLPGSAESALTVCSSIDERGDKAGLWASRDSIMSQTMILLLHSALVHRHTSAQHAAWKWTFALCTMQMKLNLIIF